MLAKKIRIYGIAMQCGGAARESQKAKVAGRYSQ
jgi:hypothetical protein